MRPVGCPKSSNCASSFCASAWSSTCAPRQDRDALLVEHTDNDHWSDGGDGSDRNELGSIRMGRRTAPVAEADQGPSCHGTRERPMPVVLGPVVEPDVKPVHAEPGGADPHRCGPGGAARGDGVPDGVPQHVDDLGRRRTHERGEMGRAGRRARRRDDEDCIAPEVGEDGHAGTARECLGERRRVGRDPRERRTVDDRKARAALMRCPVHFTDLSYLPSSFIIGLRLLPPDT